MTTDQKLIRNKLGLLDLASYLKNVSEACRVMGYSRDTFYRVFLGVINLTKNGHVKVYHPESL